MALQQVQVFGYSPDGYRDRAGFAAGLGRHLAKARYEVSDIPILRPARMRDPPIAIGEGTPGSVRKGTADDYRGMRSLHRLGPAHHRGEVDELAVIFSLGLGPDFLHRRDALAHQLKSRPKLGAVISHFLGVPAAANSE
jgi:hypothetical protein